MHEDARKLFNSNYTKGLEPNVIAYNIMIKGLSQKGLLNEAHDLFKKIEEQSCLPYDLAFNIIIQGFLWENETHKAVQLLNKMVERGFLPDARTASMIVDLLAVDGPDRECLERFCGFSQIDK